MHTCAELPVTSAGKQRGAGISATVAVVLGLCLSLWKIQNYGCTNNCTQRKWLHFFFFLSEIRKKQDLQLPIKAWEAQIRLSYFSPSIHIKWGRKKGLYKCRNQCNFFVVVFDLFCFVLNPAAPPGCREEWAPAFVAVEPATYLPWVMSSEEEIWKKTLHCSRRLWSGGRVEFHLFTSARFSELLHF